MDRPEIPQMKYDLPKGASAGEGGGKGADGIPWTVGDTALLRRVFTNMGQAFPVSNEIADSQLIRMVREAMRWAAAPRPVGSLDALREAMVYLRGIVGTREETDPAVDEFIRTHTKKPFSVWAAEKALALLERSSLSAQKILP